MLPNNFDFAMLPTGSANYSLKEAGMLSSTIEDIDYAIVSFIKRKNSKNKRKNSKKILK